MRALMSVALVAACAPRLGAPKVHYGVGAATLPLVQPSSDDRRWYVPVDAGAAGSWIFFVDTGYTHSACDDAFVVALNLKEHGHSRVYGELGSIPTRKAQLPALRIGPHVVEDLVCQTRDIGGTSSIDDPDEVRVAGVLGMDLLRRFRVVFEPESATMKLIDRDSANVLQQGPGSTSLKRELIGGRIALTVSLDGIDAKAILDTGATDTYVDGERLGIPHGRTREGVTVRGTGDTGSSVRDLTHFDIDNVQVGGTSCGPVTVTQRDRRVGTPGLLGQDVLSNYRSEFDWQHGIAHFTPSPPTTLPTWKQWSERPEGQPILIVMPKASAVTE